jgi:acyl-CoA thioesterase-1
MRYLVHSLFYVWLLFGSSELRAETPVILVVGDSLSAAYLMDREQAWPSLLQSRLNDIGLSYRVFNSSIAGDTTQSGLMRLPGLLERHPAAWVIIELGGNDGLRGIDLDVTRSNLSEMIRLSQKSGAQVLLAGMKLPPNYGSTYTDRFDQIYTSLSEDYDTLLIPFFMQDVALKPDLMQEDGIHPNAAGQPVLLETVWAVLEPALQP